MVSNKLRTASELWKYREALQWIHAEHWTNMTDEDEKEKKNSNVISVKREALSASAKSSPHVNSLKSTEPCFHFGPFCECCMINILLSVSNKC